MPTRPLTSGLRRRHCLALAGLLGAGCLNAQPAIYPSRTIRVLVGDVAGSTADAVARALGPHLQAELGQTVIVENRPGMGGALATRAVVDAPGDGHTLLLASRVAAPARATRPAQAWVVDADLMPMALVCRSLVPASTVAGAAGSAQAGSLAFSWLGLMGPANMHAGVAMRVHAAVQVALASADLQQHLAAAGTAPLPGSRQAFADQLRAEQAGVAADLRRNPARPE